MTSTKLPTPKTMPLDVLSSNAALAKEFQGHLIRLGLLDPPADGKFGRYSTEALNEFLSLKKLSTSTSVTDIQTALSEAKDAIPLKLGNDWASRIIKYMQQKQYFIAVGQQKYNIVYVEGVNADGIPNADKLNEWNDRRLVIEIVAGVPKIVGNWAATTEPGAYHTQNPPVSQGVARIAFGQYRAWQVGKHKNDHIALRQVGNLKIYRDLNKDGMRVGDKLYEGDGFGINQHWGYDQATVGKASAGCLVGQSCKGHEDFMALIQRDRRYQLSHSYIFMTTIIAGDELANAFPL